MGTIVGLSITASTVAVASTAAGIGTAVVTDQAAKQRENLARGLRQMQAEDEVVTKRHQSNG